MTRMLSAETSRDLRAGRGTAAFITLLLIIGLIGAGVWAAYTYGEGNIYIDDRTISELEPWEVIGGVIAAVIGVTIGLLAGLFGVIIGLAATFLALALAALGVFAGLFITAGVLLGPILLIILIVIALRGGKKDDDAEARV